VCKTCHCAAGGRRGLANRHQIEGGGNEEKGEASLHNLQPAYQTKVGIIDFSATLVARTIFFSAHLEKIIS